jgi:hypothetical protein
VIASGLPADRSVGVAAPARGGPIADGPVRLRCPHRSFGSTYISLGAEEEQLGEHVVEPSAGAAHDHDPVRLKSGRRVEREGSREGTRPTWMPFDPHVRALEFGEFRGRDRVEVPTATSMRRPSASACPAPLSAATTGASGGSDSAVNVVGAGPPAKTTTVFDASTGTGFVGSHGRSCERNRSWCWVLLLVFDWRDVTEAFVQAGGVVPADVLDDGELELRSGPPDAVGDQLGLEAVDERLGERVVVRVQHFRLKRARGGR